MPESPEVETIRRQLEKLIVGKTISAIEVLNPGSFRADPESLIGKTITEVGRKGKVLILALDESKKVQNSGVRLFEPEDFSESERPEDSVPRDFRIQNLYVHLKMSGQLRYRYFKTLKLSAADNRHLRVVIRFSGEDCLEFHDQRKFGWITDDSSVLPKGVDALDPKLTVKKLEEILQSSNRPIRTILLDQSKIAGIGNIYASEILWEAKISPGAKFKEEGRGKREESNKNKLVKFRKLHIDIRKILTEAIKYGGSTMDDGLYQHVGGESGNYWSYRRVYDRKGEPCLRCKTPIKKDVIGQRSTYWCPRCQ